MLYQTIMEVWVVVIIQLLQKIKLIKNGMNLMTKEFDRHHNKEFVPVHHMFFFTKDKNELNIYIYTSRFMILIILWFTFIF